MNLDRLLRPRSIAVVGATERPGSYGGEALLNLRRLRFAGAVHGVNPRRERVHGFPCVPTLADLDAPPDAVVVAIPAADAPAAVAQAGACGAGGAVVFAAGFAEAGGGGTLQERLVAAAGAHDLPVCGPNGNGIVNLAAGVALWGDMVAPREPGPVALVSQSGNLAVNALASRRGLRLHTVVSSGNEAVVSAAEYVAAIAGHDGVRAIAVYVEDEGDGARWCAALERCAREGVRVAMLKAGLSGAGAAAAQAHTGAVAGDGRVFRALAEEAGAAWATDPHELLELAKALAADRTRRPATRPGRGVAIMTCSGGDSSVAADLAEELGLPLPPLAPRTVAALEAILPAAATASNPLDYTSLLWEEPEALRRLVHALAADPRVERLLVLYDEPDALDGAAADTWAGVLDAVRAAARQIETPVTVASTLPELLADDVAHRLLEDGLAAVAGLRTGLRVVAAQRSEPPAAERVGAVGRAAARAARHDEAHWWAEHEAKALLRASGLAVPPGRLVEDAADAAAFQAQAGAPVALKLSARALRHKTELGAVETGLATPEAVRAAFARLRSVPGVRDAAVLAERMAPPGADLLVSVRADGVVPVLVVGLGGLWTEALGDVAVLALPASTGRVEAALRGLRGAPLLAGGRGRRALDLGAAARLAAGAGELLLDAGLALLELNPVIVSSDGAVAVDALAAGPPPPAAPVAGGRVQIPTTAEVHP
jgi:acetate---CoA ligase (ADP-forming)